MYRIGVISDTHGLLREDVLEYLKGCHVILHGGDINKQSILDTLQELAPVHAVRGNNDKEWAEYLPETLDITLAGLRIYMIHNKKQIKERICGKDIIIYGHSHKYEEKRENGQLWLNPGSCGARRFGLPITMAVIEIEEGGRYQVKKIELPASEKNSKTLPAGSKQPGSAVKLPDKDLKTIIRTVMKETDRKTSIGEIASKCGISLELAEQICRLYVTHPGIDADGIMNKM